jgi:hypothetical protein
MKKRYFYPLYRYSFGKYKLLLNTKTNTAEIGIVKDKEGFKEFGDFALWFGVETIKTFEAESPRKAYNQAKEWILKEK